MSKRVTVFRRATPAFPDEKIPARWTRAELIAQALIDVNEDGLWVGRDEYRMTLRGQLDWHIRGTLKESGLLGMWKIIEWNKELREKKRAASVVVAPAAPPTMTEAAPAVSEDRIVCNPPLPVRYIGMGWGFKDGTIVARMQRRFPTAWPQPLDLPGHKTALYRYSDIAVFTELHQADLRAARDGQRMQEVDAVKEEVATLRAEIARLKGTSPVAE
jgi:hypothetical protein